MSPFDQIVLFCTSLPVWPLTFLLIVLLVLKQIKDDIQPIFRAAVVTITAQTPKYAMLWTMAVLLGFSAMMMPLAEEATKLGWTMVAAGARVAAPCLLTMVGLLQKSPSQLIAETHAPFPPTPSKT